MRHFINSWNATLTQLMKRPARRARSTGYRRSLRIEGLEDRRLLAVFTVNSNADNETSDTFLTLREALTVVNFGSTSGTIPELGPFPGRPLSEAEKDQIDETMEPLGTNDVIRFDPLPAGTVITLSSSQGALPIQKSVVIDGPGIGQLTIDGGDATQIFDIIGVVENVSINVTVSGLSIRNGLSASGSAISIRANESDEVLLTDLHVYGSEGSASIFVDAFGDTAVDLTRLIVGHEDPALANNGGGVLVHMRGNVYQSVGPLGNPDVTITGSQIVNNVGANGAGVAVFNGNPASLSITGNFRVEDSVITGNKSNGHGGGLYIYMAGDYPYDPAPGSEPPGFAVIERSTVADNKADDFGGGLALKTPVRFFPSSFETVQVKDSTISSNTAYGQQRGYSEDELLGGGGGIWLAPGYRTATVTNSTISGNRGLNGGGLMISHFAGSPAKVNVRHTTIAFNAAGPFDPTDPTRSEYEYLDADVPEFADDPQDTSGGGVFVDFSGMFGRTVSDLPIFDHTIITENLHYVNEPNDAVVPYTNNTPDIGRHPIYFGEGELVTVIATHTIIGDFGSHIDDGYMALSGGTAQETDPLLDSSLADNGGPTLTHKLLAGSPAIDAGASSGSFPLFDQRGIPFDRVVDISGIPSGQIDIGAYEVQIDPKSTPPAPKVLGVAVSGSSWTAPPRTVAPDSAAPTAPVHAPFAGIDRIHVRFDEPISAGITPAPVDPDITPVNDVSLIVNEGSNRWITAVEQTADDVIVIHVNKPLDGHSITITVEDTTIDLVGNKLDGERVGPSFWVPSGNNIPEGDLAFVLLVNPGDYNKNGTVDAADYTIWRDTFGSSSDLRADGNGNGVIDQADYDIWKANFNDVIGGPSGGAALAIVPGDFNADGTVDNDDRAIWQANYGSTTNLAADGNKNGIIDLADLAIWQEMFMVTTLETIPGDFNSDGVVDMQDHGQWSNSQEEADWHANFGMTNAGILPLIINSGSGMSFEIPNKSPQVTGIRVGGSNSTHAEYDFASAVGSGEQLRTVPVGGLDSIFVSFSEEVYVSLGALALTGLQGQTIPPISPTGFTYDVVTRTATWQFTDPLPHGQYLVTLSDSIFDLDHEALDGEFTNPWSLNEAAGQASEFPAGDGKAGGDFRFRFTNMSGDFSRNNIGDFADFSIWQTNEGMASGAQQTHGDADGDGDVDIDDGNMMTDQQGFNRVSWPSIEPGMILVSTLSDEDDGDHSLGDLSLREALVIAAGVGNPGRDTIVFRDTLFGGEIDLSLGQLNVTSDVDIVGPGALRLTIDGQEGTRIFSVSAGVTASITGLMLMRGRVTGTFDGGAIRNEGHLTLDAVILADNESGDYGGAIYSSGPLHIRDSTLQGNSAGFTGGAISISNNATDSLVIDGSALIENTAPNYGALHINGNNGSGTAHIINSTFSGNWSTWHAGAIQVASNAPAVTIVNSTITNNQAGASYEGGGLRISGGSSVTLHNTILAGNWAGVASKNDLSGSLQSASSYNLLGANVPIPAGPGNYRLDATEQPGLSLLGDYGGHTKTHALLSSSPAIDRGSNAKARDHSNTPLAGDQRGFTRIVDETNTTNGSGGTVDIGAFEFAAPITVSTLVDSDNGEYHPGDLSLREALDLAATLDGADNVDFAPELNGEISIGSEFVIHSDVKIQGPGQDVLTIDANQNSRVFSVNSGVTSTIAGLTITGGNAGSGTGGGIYSEGNLTVEDARIKQNSAYVGGGVYQTGGNLSVVRTEIDANNASHLAGGIMTSETSSVLIDSSAIVLNSATTAMGGVALTGGGDADVYNTTISSNSAGAYAGIYSVVNTAELISVTIANNLADSGDGAGLYGQVTMHNSIVVNNPSNGTEANIDSILQAGSSYNMVRSGSSGGLSDGVDGNIVLGAAADAGLAALDYYSSSTRAHALRDISRAIDAGSNAIVDSVMLSEDQRGFDRKVDWDFDLEERVDIGAFELVLSELFS